MPFLIVNNLKYHYEVTGCGPPLVLLHGFTGSTENWIEHTEAFASRFQVMSIDLPGHGLTDAPDDPSRYAMKPVAADAIALMTQLAVTPFHLLGYSMGGRLALYVALHYADRLCSLVLESASPGLATEAERSERIRRDETLAEQIERDGIEAFVDTWERLPLFASQQRLPDALKQRLREQRLHNNPHGLANSLRGMGTGVQPQLWRPLPQLNVPVLLLAGQLDTKFVGIGQRMYDLLPEARLVIVPDAGHTVHLEQPAAFQSAVLTFLRGKHAHR